MSILYALVSKSKTIVLASYTECMGNFEQLTLKILEKVEKNKRATYSYDKHFFHYVENDNLVFMCMTEQSFARPAAFVFLDDIRETFLKTFNQNEIQRAFAHSFQNSFSDILKTKMQHYNSNSEDIDRVAKLEKGVRSYSEEIIQANELIEQRAGKISLMVKKAENLRTESKSYFQKSKKVKNTTKCNKIILISSIVFIVLVIIYVCIGFGCGFDFSKCTNNNE